MLKTIIGCLVLVLFFVLARITNIFAILSSDIVFYLSLGLVVIMLVATVLIVGIPEPKDHNDDKTND